MVKNILLKLAYDGSKFSGFQAQKDEVTVAEELEKAILKVTGFPSRVIAAGRTDAGVHACAQVVNFLTASSIPPEAFQYKLVKYLPDSIRILVSKEVPLTFHARFARHRKHYRYVIHNDAYMHPIYNNYLCHVTYKLDQAMMQEAAKYLVGEHDFRSFLKYGEEKSTVRRIDSIEVSSKGNRLMIDFVGESFLHNQVRIMVGTLVNVGRGLWPPDRVKEILGSKDRLKSGMTYPASGLYLMDIDYEAYDV